MVQRAGEFVHFGPQLTRILRLQSGGLSGVTIPDESIKEVGSDLSIERVFDTPDSTFECESYDLTTSFERMLLRRFGTPSAGEEIDFGLAVPIDIAVPWRRKRGSTQVRGGSITPYLYLQQAAYRFGVQQNATQTFTLRGDASFWVPGGSPRMQEFTKAGQGPYAFDDVALKTVDAGVDVYALCVTLYNENNDTPFRRLLLGDDFTNTSAGFTLSAAVDAAWDDGTTTIVVSYGTAVQDTIDDTGIPLEAKPSSYKGRDADLFISDGAATPTVERWRGVQSAEATWSVNYEADYELGNKYPTDRNYDVPDVTGSIVLRPEDGDYLIQRIAITNGADPDDIQNMTSTVPQELTIKVYHPKHHNQVMKTLYCPDARITVPATPVRAGQKSDYTFPWKSDTGTLLVYNGDRP